MNARETLIQVGLVEFLAHGYDGAGMARILAAAGISRGGFYHHFSGKLKLFEEVIDQHLPSPLASLDWTAHGELDADGQKRAIAALYHKLSGLGDAPSGDLTRYYALFFDALSRLPRYRHEMSQTYGRLISMLATALESDGGTPSDQARRAARAFIAALEGELYLSAVTDIAMPGHNGS